MEPVAREPSPLEELELTETFEELLWSLEERELEILLLRLQDYSVEEISRETNRSARTVRRVCRQIRDWLEDKQRE